MKKLTQLIAYLLIASLSYCQTTLETESTKTSSYLNTYPRLLFVNGDSLVVYTYEQSRVILKNQIELEKLKEIEVKTLQRIENLEKADKEYSEIVKNKDETITIQKDIISRQDKVIGSQNVLVTKLNKSINRKKRNNRILATTTTILSLVLGGLIITN